LFACLFPILRNALMIKYLGGRRASGDDIGVSALLGFMEGLFFTFAGLDAIHPLVAPIRLFGAPLVYAPFLKVTGLDKKIFDYAKWK
ncbi:MAG: hypothetical protein L6408_06875, partial [Nanoarchaeota archaeon]|nr:hypothetical protein [Nanoarchaeota archaeon]